MVEHLRDIVGSSPTCLINVLRLARSRLKKVSFSILNSISEAKWKLFGLVSWSASSQDLLTI